MSTALRAIEVFGIIAFASSGFIEARRKKMDLIGVFTVAFITAFGGGTLRDILLDRRPLFWVQHQEYTLLIFVLALVVLPLSHYLQSSTAERAIIFADALGLGLFSAVGASVAQEMQMPLFICVMMGVITAIFGGVLRDVICNEIPLVFRRGQLYATCAFVGCWVYLILNLLDVHQTLALLSSILVTFVMRLLAVRFDLKLPA
ncbi:trimeric intracellular cation channel family protein [Herminiimonas sp. CN]|uniref:trimeric intracellular cation channel family protein n=1 Tax=Herminiimonas sp. CN TaxID=1349818 RepID=UPI0005552431|nr:trimeric intracellular cation channel family protein [Herminiimonas sp. CN]